MLNAPLKFDKTLTLNKKRKRAPLIDREKAKVKLRRLNRIGLPKIREFDPFDKEQKDLKVLWAAYMRGSFSAMPKNLEQYEFIEELERVYATSHNVLILEDFNKINHGKLAPVAILTEVIYDGWTLEPHADFFSWATSRNKLRCIVNYLRHARQLDGVGVCLVKCLKEDVLFFERVREYNVLFPLSRFDKEFYKNNEDIMQRVGVIRNGDPRGDLYQYSLMCREQPK